jgi:hypothetical protein
MSWLDRIKAIFRPPAPSPVYADEGGLERDGQRHPYAELQGAVAFRHPNYLGDTLTVALDFGDRRLLVLSEHDAAWHLVLASLDAHPRVQRQSTRWLLTLVAGAENIDLFTRELAGDFPNSGSEE